MASGMIKTLRAAILAVLGTAAGSGLLAADAAAKVLNPREDDDTGPPLLLAPPQLDPSELLAHSSHRSHQSHRSHRSHSSGHGSHNSHNSHYSSAPSGGSASGGWSGDSSSGGSLSGGSSSGGSSTGGSSGHPSKPKPGKVSIVALPGGSIFVDGKRVGSDETKTLTLSAGVHQIKIENRFLGDHEESLVVEPGDSRQVTIKW